jgi:hypothetical protein
VWNLLFSLARLAQPVRSLRKTDNCTNFCKFDADDALFRSIRRTPMRSTLPTPRAKKDGMDPPGLLRSARLEPKIGPDTPSAEESFP